MKTLEEMFQGYYNPLKALSYGKEAIFSVGTRGIGKSTDYPIYFLWHHLKHHSTFVYIRRTEKELDLNAPTFLLNVEQIMRRSGYDMPPITYKKRRYYMGRDILGYAVALNQQSQFKSITFENTWFTFYDEFMAGMGGSRYLGGKAHPMQEVVNMELLYQTIDREIDNPHANKLTAIFVGNADTLYNPFFIAHGADRFIRPDTRYLAPKDAAYVYENTDLVDAISDYENSRAYRFSVLTRGYSFKNEFQDNNSSEFIQKDPDGTRIAMFNFAYDGNTYGVYKYSKKGFLYISDRSIEGRQTFALTTEDHRPNMLLIRQWHGNPATSLVKEMYELGRVRFRTMKCKNMLDFYVKFDV